MADIEEKDCVQVSNTEMVLDDILGDDIIGETSDQEDEKRSPAMDTEEPSTSKERSRNNSYASDISSKGSVPKTDKIDWTTMDARYFVIKSNNMDNVEIAMEKSMWATPRRNEDMLVEAFRHTKHVILIFSVRESGHFQGVARMMTIPRPNKGEIQWVVGHTPLLRILPNLFKIQWLDKTALDFQKTAHIKNRWNEWKQVKISRDGQEVEPVAAAELLSLWPNCEDPDNHTPTIPSRAESQSSSRTTKKAREEPVSPSAVKTTYSTYKDESYKAEVEQSSDKEETSIPSGISNRLKDRLGTRGEHSKRRGGSGGDSSEQRPPPPSTSSSTSSHRSSRPDRSHGRSSGSRRDDERSRDHARSSRDPHRHRSERSSKSSRSRRSRSPNSRSSAKNILLNGSYSDYVREYQSKSHSRLAQLLQDPLLRQDIFAAAQVAAAAASSSSSSRSSRRLDSRAHSALVDEFLNSHTRR